MGNAAIWHRFKKVVPALALTLTMSSGSVLAKGNDGQHADQRDGQQEQHGNHEVDNQQQNRLVDVQLLGINDFHGQINITRKVAGKEVGRADYLAAYLQQHKAQNPKNTLMVHAGDAVGASAPASALLQDEPTIDILNQIGFDVGTLGNHEFDKGVTEMKRLIYGGKNPKTGADFEGADFQYVDANVVDENTGKPILKPYTIKRVGGVPIGFIGVTLKSTPSIVTPSGVKGVKFTDEAEAINKYTHELQRRGVHAIVVLAHNAGTSDTKGGNASGELVDIAKKVDKDVDVIFGGHNHAFMNAVIDGKLLVQSYSYGTAFSDVDLQIDPRTKDIVTKKAEIVTTFHDGITPDPVVKAMVDKAEAKVAPIINEVVGNSQIALPNDGAYTGEIALGNLIADSMRSQMKSDFAFMNPGGIRAGIAQGTVTWGNLFTVQPFYNDLIKMDLTGSQVKALLEQQWVNGEKILQISGLSYSFDSSKPVGERITDIKLPNGNAIDMAATYSATVNNFMASGGDGYTALLGGKNNLIGTTDIDALVNYVKTLPNPFEYKAEGRITKLNK